MTSRHVFRIALIGILSLALCCKAGADTLQSDTNHIVAGAIAVVAVVVVVTVVLIHQASSNRTITGCVNPSPEGLSVTNEKDKRVYTISGDTTGVKPGDRMTLHLKKIKTKGSNALTWQPEKITKDFGACQP